MKPYSFYNTSFIKVQRFESKRIEESALGDANYRKPGNFYTNSRQSRLQGKRITRNIRSISK